jgi:hypothetical protein
MSDHEIGYGKPPKHTQFKVGNRANPKGRPKRGPLPKAEIIDGVLNESTQYIEEGRQKKATRHELAIKKVLSDTLKGDMKAALLLLNLYAHAQKFGDPRGQVITVHDWQPDYPGQTAEQKTREFAARGALTTPAWWEKSDKDPTDGNS